LKTVVFSSFCTIFYFAENFDHNLTSTELVKFDEPRYVFASLSLEQSMQAILARSFAGSSKKTALVFVIEEK